MSELAQKISQAVLELTAPDENAQGAKKKNYTEALSHRVSDILTEELRALHEYHRARAARGCTRAVRNGGHPVDPARRSRFRGSGTSGRSGGTPGRGLLPAACGYVQSTESLLLEQRW